MTTALNIIEASLRKIGAIDPGETTTSQEAADGLEALNDMMAQWSAEGMLIYANTLENFTLTSQSSYTIGTGGVFNTEAPITIDSAFTRIDNIDYPCDIIAIEDYNNLSFKTSTGSYPEIIAYRSTSPLGTIYTYPVSTGTLYLDSRKLFQQFANTATVYTMPSEVLLGVKTNLSMILAPEYGKSVDENLAQQAASSKALLKSLYVSVPRASFDFTGRSRNLSILGG